MLSVAGFAGEKPQEAPYVDSKAAGFEDVEALIRFDAKGLEQQHESVISCRYFVISSMSCTSQPK